MHTRRDRPARILEPPLMFYDRDDPRPPAWLRVFHAAGFVLAAAIVALVVVGLVVAVGYVARELLNL